MTEPTTHDVMLAQTEAFADTLAYFQGYRDALEADKVQHAADVAAAVGDLPAAINNQMRFEVGFDPDGADVHGDGGTYTELPDIVANAPVGSAILINIAAGKTCAIADNVDIPFGRTTIATDGDGVNAILTFAASINSLGNNVFKRLTLQNGGCLVLSNIGIQMSAKADAAEVFAQNGGTPIQGALGSACSVVLNDCAVTGQDGAGLINLNDVNMAFNFSSVAADGDMALITNGGLGFATLSRRALSYSNSARLNDGGVVGTNLLMNT